MKARPGGPIGSVVASIEDSLGIGIGIQALIFILICLIPILLFARGKRQTEYSNKQGWQELDMGMGYSAPMPNAAPVSAQFGLQNNQQENIQAQNSQVNTGPPIPDSGLPEGWTMEQWSYYGSAWLSQQQEESMGIVENPMNNNFQSEPTPVQQDNSAFDLLSNLETNIPSKTDPLSAFEDDDLDF